MEHVQIDSKFADKQGEIMVIELGGHVDQSNSYQVQKMFESIIQSGCFKVIVDFGKLFYMSSAGWGVFIGEIKRFRDNGGDIKLANMNSEIYDVYQMLEFYHILEDYSSVQEAAFSFKSETGDEINLLNDLHQTEEYHKQDTIDVNENTYGIDENINVITPKSEIGIKDTEIIDFIPSVGRTPNLNSNEKNEIVLSNIDKNVKLSELPIYEKVKKVIAQNPLIGVLGIRKVLKHEHFGYTRISVFKLWRLLKELDLSTKAKRYRYYRSC